MKERPILFSGPMVRALLEGRKTQTRRIVKPQPPSHHFTVGHDAHIVIDRHGEQQPGKEFFGIIHTDGEWSRTCPYGEPGDQLWVRETWAPSVRDPESEHDPRTGENCDAVHCASVDPHALWTHYEDDEAGGLAVSQVKPTWRPSIHMPRWASRITLVVTSVRVGRLQDITEGDAKAEGVAPFPYDAEGDCWTAAPPERRHRTAFEYLWGEINGYGPTDARKPGASWAENPYVWVIGVRQFDGEAG